MRSPRQLQTSRTHAQTARRSRRTGALVACGWTTLGFICGALFWHLIGFWDFVGQIVLKGRIDDTTAAAEPQRVPVAQRPTGSITPSRVAMPGRGPAATKAYLTCSIASPVADEGETIVVPCPPGTPPAPAKSLAKKGDLLPTNRAAHEAVAVAPAPWSATIKGQFR